MADKPIIFSAPMVRALLDGRKTQTRRIIKDRGDLPQFCGGKYDDRNDPECWGWEDFDTGVWVTLDQYRRYNFVPYAHGDRLWVREAFCMNPAVRHADRRKNVIFRAEVPDHEPPIGGALTLERIEWVRGQGLKWRPSIHMPRWASRLTLTVTDVRVQRLQQITAEECTAEGVPFETDALAPYEWSVSRFADLWNSLHGPDAWDANPWVLALTFTVQRENIDRVEASK